MVMNSLDYKQKLKNLLEDTTVYEVLKKDPTATYENRLVKILREWKREGTISDNVYHKIYLTSEDVLKFDGLPKIHKKDSPLRPIVSGIGSISYKVAKYLAAILNPLTGKMVSLSRTVKTSPIGSET